MTTEEHPDPYPLGSKIGVLGFDESHSATRIVQRTVTRRTKTTFTDSAGEVWGHRVGSWPGRRVYPYGQANSADAWHDNRRQAMQWNDDVADRAARLDESNRVARIAVAANRMLRSGAIGVAHLTSRTAVIGHIDDLITNLQTMKEELTNG